MNEINVLIVEDEPIISEYISECVKHFGYKVMETCYSIQDAITACKFKTPDIALLDIHLGDEKDGIDLAYYLKKEYDFPIIFITSFTQDKHLERAKKASPSAYLIKPFDKNTLHASISLALHNSSLNKPATITPAEKNLDKDPIYSLQESFFIKNKGRFEKVMFKDILWMEANDAYTMIYTQSGRHMVHHSLKKMEEKVGNEQFMRIHRSYIVNLNRIESVAYDHLIINGQTISIGKSYKTLLMEQLNLL